MMCRVFVARVLPPLNVLKQFFSFISLITNLFLYLLTYLSDWCFTQHSAMFHLYKGGHAALGWRQTRKYTVETPENPKVVSDVRPPLKCHAEET